MNHDNKNIFDEIIIGSGFACLYWYYKTKPKNFLILEKSNRIGGRVYNKDWNKYQISLGGGVIKPSNNLMIELLNELQIETGESISKYHLIDLETNSKNTNKPNENNFYELNKIIIEYLKKIYEKNKNKIKKNKLTFNNFLDLFLDYKISSLIKSNLLYKSYSNADVKSVLDNEIEELLRTEDFKLLFIKKLGYTNLLNKLIEIIGIENIYTKKKVIKIENIANFLFKITTSNNEYYLTKKIILATESKNNIYYDLNENTNNLLKLYNMVSGSNYIRVYSFHKKGHGLDCSYRTNGIVGKVIYINPYILMCCYTEETQAQELHKLLNES